MACPESYRYGIADLFRDRGLRTDPESIVGEALKLGCLEMSDGSMLNGVEVSAFFGLEEFSSYRD